MNKKDTSSIFCPQLLLLDVFLTHNLRSGWGYGGMLNGHFWRLYYNTKPGAGVYINGKRVEIFPDRLYLLTPNCGLKTFCDAEGIGQLFCHFEIPQYPGSLEQHFFELPLENENRTLLEKLMDKIKQNESSSQVKLLSISLASLCLSQLIPEALNERETDQRIFQSCIRIHTYPEHNFTLEQMAKQAEMNPKSFLRAFRKATGTTPYQYLQQIRYTISARLLRSTALSIKEICEQVGCNDRFHFSRQFKAIYGMPPATYRKKFGANIYLEQ